LVKKYIHPFSDFQHIKRMYRLMEQYTCMYSQHRSQSKTP
jgi:hypothetical protein